MKYLILSFLIIQFSVAATSIVSQEAFPKLRFIKPLFLTAAGDGSDRIFILEQAGKIKVFPNRDTVEKKDVKVFLDLSKIVSSLGNEEGLLGLAFDPKYKDTGRFFVYYSKTSPRRTVIARYNVDKKDKNLADPKSEEILLKIPQPFSNHNGGMMAFGPDGFLYVGVGDGGSGDDPQGNGQNKKTLLGSLLRIDVSPKKGYQIPADNPFVSLKDGEKAEIYAYGLRNPWRFSFDFKTKKLWVADVGQNAFEEIDIVEKGDNLGWKLFEGKNSYINPKNVSLAKTKAPIHVYPRSEGTSVTGGYVYRGEKLKSLVGKYIFADFTKGQIWSLSTKDFKKSEVKKLAKVQLISSFGEDSKGEIYVVSLLGKIHRLTEAKETTFFHPEKDEELVVFDSLMANNDLQGLNNSFFKQVEQMFSE